jgi:hypothetical protein
MQLSSTRFVEVCIIDVAFFAILQHTKVILKDVRMKAVDGQKLQ